MVRWDPGDAWKRRCGNSETNPGHNEDEACEREQGTSHEQQSIVVSSLIRLQRVSLCLVGIVFSQSDLYHIPSIVPWRGYLWSVVQSVVDNVQKDERLVD